MTAAALKYHELPSMARAVDAMYDWMGRRLNLGKKDVVVDTGSGLSRQTQLSARHIAEVLRVAGGYSELKEHDPLHRGWLDSLAFADGAVRDGTLRGRFRSGLVGRLRGKTGTLSTSIALSGVLEADPERPLVFSIVTNGSSALPKGRVRAGHDRIIALLGQYLTKRPGALTPPPALAGAKPAAGDKGAGGRRGASGVGPAGGAARGARRARPRRQRSGAAQRRDGGGRRRGGGPRRGGRGRRRGHRERQGRRGLGARARRRRRRCARRCGRRPGRRSRRPRRGAPALRDVTPCRFCAAPPGESAASRARHRAPARRGAGRRGASPLRRARPRCGTR
jgi:hypothetical protein